MLDSLENTGTFSSPFLEPPPYPTHSFLGKTGAYVSDQLIWASIVASFRRFYWFPSADCRLSPLLDTGNFAMSRGSVSSDDYGDATHNAKLVPKSDLAAEIKDLTAKRWALRQQILESEKQWSNMQPIQERYAQLCKPHKSHDCL